MAPKAKKEAPAPPKAKAKAKALKAKKVMLKGVHSHQKKKRRRRRKRSACHPPSGGLGHCGSEGSLNMLRRAPPGGTSLTTMHHQVPPDLSQP